jgi:hypothetical protein
MDSSALTVGEEDENPCKIHLQLVSLFFYTHKYTVKTSEFVSYFGAQKNNIEFHLNFRVDIFKTEKFAFNSYSQKICLPMSLGLVYLFDVFNRESFDLIK